MRAYLDYNATAPLRPQARAALLSALETAGNASSPHAEGQKARAALEEARQEVAALVSALAREVVFTGSGTEALNLALASAVRSRAPFARDQVVLSAVEHDAVRATARAFAGEGIQVIEVAVDGDGRLRLDRLEAAVGERTALVAVMLANNETGVLQPVLEARRIARERGALLVVDAVQAAGKVAIDFRELGADYLALSAHKLGGPQGVGALIVRRGAPLEPIIRGGGQERGRRAGTESVAAIAGFGAAARAAREGLAAETIRLEALRDRLEERLAGLFPASRVNGRGAPRLPSTTSVTLPGHDAEALVVRLDLDGIAASTGSACATGSAEPSHVLRAMGLGPAEAGATLRFSLGWASREEDVERAAQALAEAARAQCATGLGPRDSGSDVAPRESGIEAAPGESAIEVAPRESANRLGS